MSSSGPLNNVEPRPMDSPGPTTAVVTARSDRQDRSPLDQAQYASHQQAPEASPQPHASATMVNGPNPGQVNNTFTPTPPNLRNARATCEYNMREYINLKAQMQKNNTGIPNHELSLRLRHHANAAMGDLHSLQSVLKTTVKAAENHRWRRWVVGGGLGAFIPLVRKIFKRGDNKESEDASNDTEYAFNKSKGLLSRIKGSIFGQGGWATITFFVFAVLYVFQNEVSLRVAKTIQKRARKLLEKVESGQGDFEESDMKLLQGWRWRILMW